MEVDGDGEVSRCVSVGDGVDDDGGEGGDVGLLLKMMGRVV